jgi:hypothetical protein
MKYILMLAALFVAVPALAQTEAKKDAVEAKKDLKEAKKDAVEAKKDLKEAKKDAVEAKKDLKEAKEDV